MSTKRLLGGMTGLAVVLALAPAPALAWGNDGHRVIGLIAEHFLTAPEKARVQAMLAGASDPDIPATMRDRATWADAYRDSDRNGTQQRYKGTRNWHFVDIDYDHPDLAVACFGDGPQPGGLASQGPAEDCVVRKIEQFSAELSSPRTSPAERRLALMFLLHFVGDVHQPLHAAERRNDQGGNLVFVVRGDDTYGETLHGWWDSRTVSGLGGTPEVVADRLIAQIRVADIRDWRADGPREWAQASYVIARNQAYAIPAGTRSCQIKHFGRPDTTEDCHPISEGYVNAARDKTAEQLKIAGVRLAWVISKGLAATPARRPSAPRAAPSHRGGRTHASS